MMRDRRSPIALPCMFLIGAFLISAFLVNAFAAQEPAVPRFRTGVAGISIDALVTDRDRPVPNLTAADFELIDSGVPQQVEVAIVKDRPIDVILSLDTSPSIGDAGLRHLVSATDKLFAALTPRDRAALVTGSQAVVIHHGLTGDFDRLRALTRRIGLIGRSAVIDAIYAATTLQQSPDRPAMLLIVSDGLDNSSWLSAEDIVDVVRHNALVPYAVALLPHMATGEAFRGGEAAVDLFLREFVETGGGQVIPAGNIAEVERHLIAALDNFRQRYLLTYTPRGVERPGWHPVTIKVKNPGWRVDARAGYVVP